jgi:3-oxoacyl-[acyl-carrier protein] reductase
MLLTGKNAVLYGGAGNIGGAVAREFAREGAKVHLAGRTLETLKAVGDEIGAQCAVVDALDPQAVEAHAAAVGRIDISFNLIDVKDVQGTPMAEMDVEDFLSPIVTATRSHFLTWQAAARHGAGVILVFGGEGDPVRGYSIGGFQVALHALEAMRRQFSTENRNVRVVTLRTGGIRRRSRRRSGRARRSPRASMTPPSPGARPPWTTSPASPPSSPPTGRGR